MEAELTEDLPETGRSAARRRVLGGIAVLLVVALALLEVWPALRPSDRDGAGGPVVPALAADTDSVRILAGLPASVDPARHGDYGSAAVIAQLYETLTAVDPTLVVRPALAESWRIEEEGLRVVFRMRGGLRFSDGTALTASDVVRSWRRLFEPGRISPLASLLGDVAGVRDILAGRGADPGSIGVSAPDDLTVVVELDRPGGDLPAIVSSPPFAVVPPSASVDEILPDPDGFVGSGGYVLSAVEPDALVLEANDRYWAGRPEIDSVRIVTSLGGIGPVDAFAAGEVDYAPIGSYDATWIAYDATLGPSLREEPPLSVTYYGFDASRPPFDDVRVRQAFGAAVDWRRLAALDDPGSSTPATGMVPSGIPNRPDGDFLPAYDPDQARALFAAAGYPGGRGFPAVRLVTSGGGYDGAVKTSLEATLDIDLDYALMDFGAYTDRLETDPPAMWSLIWVADYPGPNDFLGILLGQGSTANYGRWASPPFERAIEEATSAADAAAARAAYARAMAVVRDEVPVVPVSYGSSWALSREGLLGATGGGTGILRFAGLAWAVAP